MKFVATTKNAEETRDFGSLIASHLQKQDVVTLQGDLGAGKTTFAQGFAKGLGIMGVVNSPTFNIIKCYFNGRIPLYHIDAYRLEGMKQDLGWDEYFEGDGISLVEWPEYLEYALTTPVLKITIETMDENTRLLTLEGTTPHYEEVLKEVKAHVTTTD